MADSADYILELGGKVVKGPTTSNAKLNRPWISVLWRCCGVYSRVYRNRAATAYEGHCPKCARPVRVKIGPGGTSTRLFEVH